MRNISETVFTETEKVSETNGQIKKTMHLAYTIC